ncbi:MAG TPA: lysophospholipid acyltransferase family protein [Terriglobia bacterium]|nr:lysophospholipid acyltransferase family protein [Terriglobia bacterium]
MESESDVRSFTASERFKARLIGWAGYFAIGIIGCTVRWRSVGGENFDAILKSGHRAIFTFWHGRIFPSTYYWRKRGIVVMTSQNLDGEGIAQCIQRFGFGVARGSSSRGGFRALAQLARDIRGGKDAAFTIDGPRGPRYVAKQGPVLLAFKTGAAVFCFHISMKHKIQLKSWDEFQIPLPFTEAVVLQAEPIWAPPGSSEDELRAIHGKMQETLDSLRVRGDSWWSENSSGKS